MKLQYKNNKTTGECRLIYDEVHFDRQFYSKDRNDKLLTIAWNRGESQPVNIDGIEYEFPSNTIICLMVNQSYTFSKPGKDNDQSLDQHTQHVLLYIVDRGKFFLKDLLQ